MVNGLDVMFEMFKVLFLHLKIELKTKNAERKILNLDQSKNLLLKRQQNILVLSKEKIQE